MNMYTIYCHKFKLMNYFGSLPVVHICNISSFPRIQTKITLSILSISMNKLEYSNFILAYDCLMKTILNNFYIIWYKMQNSLSWFKTLYIYLRKSFLTWCNMKASNWIINTICYINIYPGNSSFCCQLASFSAIVLRLLLICFITISVFLKVVFKF